VVQGLVIHYREGERFGYAIPEERLPEVDTRYAQRMLARILAMDNSPLTEQRPPERRLVGCCRDFTVLFLALARHVGVPARARVGFASYFDPSFNYDHEVAARSGTKASNAGGW
jgi:transglutaminase-like putative cysteine protease